MLQYVNLSNNEIDIAIKKLKLVKRCRSLNSVSALNEIVQKDGGILNYTYHKIYQNRIIWICEAEIRLVDLDLTCRATGYNKKEAKEAVATMLRNKIVRYCDRFMIYSQTKIEETKEEEENNGDSEKDPYWMPEWIFMSQIEKKNYLDKELDYIINNNKLYQSI